MIRRLLCRLMGHREEYTGADRIVRANATTYINHYCCLRCEAAWHTHEIFYRDSTKND